MNMRNKRVQFIQKSLIRVSVGAAIVSAVVITALTASADGSGNAEVLPNIGCMEDTAGIELECAEGNVSISQVASVAVLDDGCLFPGDTVTFHADYQVLFGASNPQARHDIGLWFATDGDSGFDGALTGTCTAAAPAYAPDPPWLDLDGKNDAGIQDTCGDSDAEHESLIPRITLTATCIDTDNDGYLNLPYCISWRQPESNTLCISPAGAFPGGPADCQCDNDFNVPITVPPAKLRVVTTAIPDRMSEPGGEVSLTVEVTNTSLGNSVKLLNLTDDADNEGTSKIIHDASEVCKNTFLEAVPPGNTTTCTFKRNVAGNTGDRLTGKITVTALDQLERQVEGGNSATVIITDIPSAIQVDKLVEPTILEVPGGPVSYVVTITNISPVDDVFITAIDDPDFGGDIRQYCYNDPGGPVEFEFPATLAPGGIITCTTPGTVIGMDGDRIIRKASASGKDDDGRPVSDEGSAAVFIQKKVTLVGLGKFVMPKRIPEPGGAVKYLLEITNASIEDNITIKKVYYREGGALNSRDCSPNLPAKLPPGEMAICTTVKNVTGNAGDGILNTVTASGVNDDGTGGEVWIKTDVNIIDVPSSLQVIKSVAPNMVSERGGAVTYTVKVLNTSAVDAVTLEKVEDPLLGGDISGFCNETIPVDLEPGEDISCTIPHEIEATEGNRKIISTAVASGTDDDGNPVSGSDGAFVDIVDIPSSILTTTTAFPASVSESGDEVTFTAVIENTSAYDAVKIQSVTDSIYGDVGSSCGTALPVNLAPGSKMKCIYKKFISGNAGEEHTSSITASGKDDDGNQVESTGDATLTYENSLPKITISKTADKSQVMASGEEVTFTIVVQNISADSDPVTIKTLADDIHGNLNGSGNCTVPQLIQPGGSYTCSFQALVGRDDTDTVTASGTDDESTPVSDSDSTTVKTVMASLEIEKTINDNDADSGPGPEIPVGSAVTWEYTVTNSGDVDLAGITVTDDDLGVVCTIASLTAGVSETCNETGTAAAGPNMSNGIATATFRGKEYTDTDPGHYFGALAKIDLQKKVLVDSIWHDGDGISTCPDGHVPEVKGCEGFDTGECRECTGRVKSMTLKYKGPVKRDVKVINQNGNELFSGEVLPDAIISFSLAYNGNLTDYITITVSNNFYVKLHTGCTVPVGPGLVAGDFEIVKGESSAGGALCSVNCDLPISTIPETSSPKACVGKITELSLVYHGQYSEHVMIKDMDSRELFSGSIYPEEPFSFKGLGSDGTDASEIKIYVDWRFHTTLKTDCSLDIGPGFRSGDFEVVSGRSSYGGTLSNAVHDGAGKSGQDICSYLVSKGECVPDEVSYKFIITNGGNVELTNLQLSDAAHNFDDIAPDCQLPATLAPGKSYSCISEPVPAEKGLIVNTADAAGQFTSSGGITVIDSDTDEAGYCGIEQQE